MNVCISGVSFMLSQRTNQILLRVVGKHRLMNDCRSISTDENNCIPFISVSSHQRTQQQQQHQKSSDKSTNNGKYTIPQPTWSIANLQLHEMHKPATIKELQILAKRAVLDIRRMDDTTKQRLCQDLGNMLHMMKQVQQHCLHDDDAKTAIDSNNAIIDDPTALYDTPRGVTEAPFRIDDNIVDGTDEERIAQNIRQSYLEPKMKRVGGHQYYEIITSIKETSTK